jgi:hypothetical protein
MIAAALAALVLVAAVYHFAFGSSTVGSHRGPARPTSVIGSGKSAVGVSAAGTILSWQPPPAEGTLPRLPLEKPPKHGRLSGPVLAQARVLGAAPAVLRSCIAGSSYGETGVDVKLASGIELRFGSASRAAQKWSSAAAILADPTITEIGYVDLHSPSRAATGGSGHTLPTPEPGASTSCGK